jgi:hypothetical protein
VKNRRQSPRRSVKEPAKIVFEDDRAPQNCIIVDVSERGARLIVDGAGDLPGTFLLFRRSDLSLREAVVVRRELKSVGVRLSEPLDLACERVRALSQLKTLSPIFAR